MQENYPRDQKALKMWRSMGAEQATERRHQSLYPIFLLDVKLMHFPFMVLNIQRLWLFCSETNHIKTGMMHNWTCQREGSGPEMQGE